MSWARAQSGARRQSGSLSKEYIIFTSSVITVYGPGCKYLQQY